MICVRADNVIVGGGSWDNVSCPYVIPEGLRPRRAWTAAMNLANGGSTTRMLRVNTDGKETAFNSGSVGSANACYGTLAYPLGV